ncbi:hypothetical protein LTR56_017083 [Elasticomyces elasticus]|nr:hypothetical protein LTR56_017083 [Elasticomyces elasticus]KAK4915175.1 hypothetical protein LTR49_016684 [Elasticomyces elasticus]KAK5744468.1 hypothetical protein LTS12_023462 [Elasticomyces elasticus]
MARSKPQHKPQEFRGILEGLGGTFVIDPSSRSIERIDHFGTWDYTTGGRFWVVRDDAEGQKIKIAVKERLTAEKNRASWGPVTGEMKARVLMVCPQQTANSFDKAIRQNVIQKCTGAYVIEAIREWLDAPDIEAFASHGGFIVKHQSDSYKLLSREDVDEIKQKLLPSAWQRQVESGPNVKSWIIAVPRAKQA